MNCELYVMANSSVRHPLDTCFAICFACMYVYMLLSDVRCRLVSLWTILVRNRTMKTMVGASLIIYVDVCCLLFVFGDIVWPKINNISLKSMRSVELALLHLRKIIDTRAGRSEDCDIRVPSDPSVAWFVHGTSLILPECIHMFYSDFVNIRKSMNDPAEAEVALAQCLALEVWVHR